MNLCLSELLSPISAIKSFTLDGCIADYTSTVPNVKLFWIRGASLSCKARMPREPKG